MSVRLAGGAGRLTIVYEMAIGVAARVCHVAAIAPPRGTVGATACFVTERVLDAHPVPPVEPLDAQGP